MPSHSSLAGQLLVASPAMGDPRFARTVILMVRHDIKGAMGIIINRPFGTRPLGALLEALGEPHPEATGEVRLFIGGPVQPEFAFILHTPDYRQPDTLDIGGRLALTASQAVLRDIATGSGPSKSLLAFGYAGWAPNQLEAELAHGAWVTAPADLALVFDEDRDKVWELAMARRTRDL
jgi:putative transcriptional regulator